MSNSNTVELSSVEDVCFLRAVKSVLINFVVGWIKKI